jgi:hypothetical protein
MSWSEQVFRYCERGQDPAFWAEPFNALTNGGFLIAAGVLAVRVRSLLPSLPRSDVVVLGLLVTLAASVGIGSFLFHTFATKWSRLADVVPIGMFMGAYLVFALRAFFHLSWRTTLALLAAFLGVSSIAASIACPQQLTSITQAAREPCLKGAMGYIPALAALAITGTLLHRRHAASGRLLAAAGIFLAAIILRWLDRDLCAATTLLGKVRGTHALWHLLNAATVYVLIAAAIDSLTQRRTADHT